jgi:hypothetical protein
VQAAETDKLPKLFTRELELVSGQGMQLLAAQPHLGLDLVAQCQQPLLGSEQRQTPRLASLVQRGLPVI